MIKNHHVGVARVSVGVSVRARPEAGTLRPDRNNGPVRFRSGPKFEKKTEPPGTSRPELPVGSVRDRPCTDALPARPAGLAFLREQMALIEPFAPLGSPT